MSFNEIVKTHYFHEVERRRDLNSSLTMPLGVLTALVAGLVAMVTNLSWPFTLAEWLTLLLGCLSLALSFIAAYHAVRATLGYMYKHPTSMGPLLKWRSEVIGNGHSEVEADRQTAALMMEQYATAADHNCSNNDQKAARIHLCETWVIAGLVAAAVTAIPYVYLKVMQIHTVGAGAQTGFAPDKQERLINERQVSPAPTAPAATPSSDERRSREHGSAKN